MIAVDAVAKGLNLVRMGTGTSRKAAVKCLWKDPLAEASDPTRRAKCCAWLKATRCWRHRGNSVRGVIAAIMAFLRCFVVPNVLVETDCDLPALARSRAIAS